MFPEPGMQERDLHSPVTTRRLNDATGVSNSPVNRQEHVRDLQVGETVLAQLRVQRAGVSHVRAFVIDQIPPFLLHLAPRRSVLNSRKEKKREENKIK